MTEQEMIVLKKSTKRNINLVSYCKLNCFRSFFAILVVFQNDVGGILPAYEAAFMHYCIRVLLHFVVLVALAFYYNFL